MSKTQATATQQHPSSYACGGQSFGHPLLNFATTVNGLGERRCMFVDVFFKPQLPRIIYVENCRMELSVKLR